MTFVKLFSVLTLMLLAGAVLAQKNKVKLDKAAITDMCGCYEVGFNFAETFSPKADYTFHDNYRSGGLEYVVQAPAPDGTISLQHILVVGDQYIVKHWRQDWVYQGVDLYNYQKGLTWQPATLTKNEAKGKWVQHVYQVDDSPRYSGAASWVHADGRHYWESTVDAPLPRREYTKRADYNVMRRRNRQEVTAYGWVHEQDNDKVIRSETGDELLAQEKGWNTYTKVADNKCQLAIDYWKEHGQFWADVRHVWNELYSSKKTITLIKKVDDKLLYERIFGLDEEWAGKENYNQAAVRQAIKEAITLHVEGDANFTALNK